MPVQGQACGPQLQPGVTRSEPHASVGRLLVKTPEPIRSKVGVSSPPSLTALSLHTSLRVPPARVSQAAVQGARAVKGPLLPRALAPYPVLPGSDPARNQELKREHHFHFLENVYTPELHLCSGSPSGNFWVRVSQCRGTHGFFFILLLPLRAV